MRERFVVEGFEDDIEQFPAGVLIEQRCAEPFDLPRVVTAADAEHHAAVGQHVGHGVVLGWAQRVLHRGDVKAAAQLDVLRQVGRVQRHQQDVEDALGAFQLEVVFGHPECAVSQAIQRFSGYLGFFCSAVASFRLGSGVR